MSKADMVVLGFLHIKPMYGYEIIQFVKDWQLDVWAGIKMPSVYKALHRLEENEYVHGKQITEGNNPPRTVYSLTRPGIAYFRQILKFFLKQKNILSQDFWLTVSFIYRSIDREFFLQALSQRIEEVENHLRYHKNKPESSRSGMKDINIPFYVSILMEVGEDIHRVELAALKKLKTEAEKAKNRSAFINEEEN